MNAEAALAEIFTVSEAVRYAAIYQDGKLVSRMREGTSHASQAESDKYEELLVNPALLTLVKQRGNIDCGGGRFVVVRFELTANPLEYADVIAKICA
jgi:hypothetical protein